MRDTNSKLIVSVGTLQDLVSLREAVLKKAGYRVVSAFSEAEALAKIYSGECGVLLLCYSVEEESRKHITKAFRECALKVALFRLRISPSRTHLMPARFFTELTEPKPSLALCEVM
jgi:hypothetical protein